MPRPPKPSFRKPRRPDPRRTPFGRRPRPDRDEDGEDLPALPKAPARREAVVEAVTQVWSDLFSSPVHLDSALAKQSKNLKTTLAQIIPRILLRPASEMEAFGVGLAEGEPWTLTKAQLARWKSAMQLAERIHGGLSGAPASSVPVEGDFPPEMIRELKASFGDKVTESLIEVLGREAPLSLRAVRDLGASELAQTLKREGDLPVRIEASKIAPYGVRLSGYAPVLGHPLFEKGAFEIQDEGSQVMALFALAPEKVAFLLSEMPGPVTDGFKGPLALPKFPGSFTVVDACAGAGGKTLAIADAMNGRGRVYAYDVSEKKLQALRRRATRAGYTNIQTVALREGDEAARLTAHAKSADVVLVDAPCTGWGVLRRNPDIKWRQEPGSLERLPQVQRRVLDLYSSLVKPGGRLVFGVCTFREAETRAVCADFLAQHPDFSAGHGGFLGPGPCDGFFMQEFVRRGSGA